MHRITKFSYILVLSAALGSFPGELPILAESSDRLLSTGKLQNATYYIPQIGNVALTEGTYQTPQLSVTLNQVMAKGDLNGDGSGDAAVFLTVIRDQAEISNYIAVILAQGNNLQNVDTVWLGGRMQIETASFEAGQISVKSLVYAPSDPPCCPSQQKQQNYRLDARTQTLLPVTLGAQDPNPGEIRINNTTAPPLGIDPNTPVPPPEGQIRFQF